jgi:hypothetical protein
MYGSGSVGLLKPSESGKVVSTVDCGSILAESQQAPSLFWPE